MKRVASREHGDLQYLLQSPHLSMPGLAGQATTDGFQLLLTGEIGRPHCVQATTNLMFPGWVDSLSLTISHQTTSLLDATVVNYPRRFYRAVTP